MPPPNNPDDGPVTEMHGGDGDRQACDGVSLQPSDRGSMPSWVAAVRLAGLFVLSMAVSGFFVAKSAKARNVRKTRSGEVMRSAMDPIEFKDGIAGRSQLHVGNESCTLMHFPLTFVSQESIQRALAGNPMTPDDDLELYREEPESPWYVPEDAPSLWSTFNCGTHALGQAVGLTRSDWLEPIPQTWTQGKSAAHAVLSNCFTVLRCDPVELLERSTYENQPDFREGDVVVFVDTRIPYGYLHFGRMGRVDGKLTMISKLGRGPTAYGSIRRTARYFAGGFNQICVLRPVPAKP